MLLQVCSDFDTKINSPKYGAEGINTNNMKIYKNENGQLVIDGEGRVHIFPEEEFCSDTVKFDEKEIGIPIITGCHFYAKEWDGKK